jgi:hypothetical protein
VTIAPNFHVSRGTSNADDAESYFDDGDYTHAAFQSHRFCPVSLSIATEPNYSGGEQEKEALVNVIQLTSKGLAEASAQAIKLDEHARIIAREIFGGSAPAKRSR